MGKAAPAAAKSLLLVARESEDASSVRAALMQLGYERRDEVYALLVAKLDDPNPSVQHAAVVALGRQGRSEAIEELAKPKIFHSPFHQIRWAAVTAIGKLGDHRTIDLLLKEGRRKGRLEGRPIRRRPPAVEARRRPLASS